MKAVKMMEFVIFGRTAAQAPAWLYVPGSKKGYRQSKLLPDVFCAGDIWRLITIHS